MPIFFYLILFILGISFTSCQQSKNQEPKTILTAVEAIQIAEQFIINQGYTIKGIDKDRRHIIFGPDEFATDTSHILQLRHNTLHPVSTAARQYKGADGMTKWAVSFAPVERENNILQAVTMDSVGVKIALPMRVREDWMLGAVK